MLFADAIFFATLPLSYFAALPGLFAMMSALLLAAPAMPLSSDVAERHALRAMLPLMPCYAYALPAMRISRCRCRR